MANRKRCEKLAIPAWFRLEAYDGLSNLTSPLDWLKQLAFRIDLKLFWQETADGHVARSSDTRFPFERDLGFDQILMQIQQDPILAVDELVKKYSHIIDFGTVNLVKRGRDPVRPMTVTDFLSIYAFWIPRKEISWTMFLAASNTMLHIRTTGYGMPDVTMQKDTNPIRSLLASLTSTER
jgi:hypothetical protein